MKLTSLLRQFVFSAFTGKESKRLQHTNNRYVVTGVLFPLPIKHFVVCESVHTFTTYINQNIHVWRFQLNLQ